MRCAVGSASIQSSFSCRFGADDGWAPAGNGKPRSAPIAAEPMPKRARKRRRGAARGSGTERDDVVTEAIVANQGDILAGHAYSQTAGHVPVGGGTGCRPDRPVPAFPARSSGREEGDPVGGRSRRRPGRRVGPPGRDSRAVAEGAGAGAIHPRRDGEARAVRHPYRRHLQRQRRAEGDRRRPDGGVRGAHGHGVPGRHRPQGQARRRRPARAGDRRRYVEPDGRPGNVPGAQPRRRANQG